MVFEICCTLFCKKAIQKLQFKITLLIEIIKHRSGKGEGARFSHLKNMSFLVATPFFWDPHHPIVTEFCKILEPFCKPHRVEKV